MRTTFARAEQPRQCRWTEVAASHVRPSASRGLFTSPAAGPATACRRAGGTAGGRSGIVAHPAGPRALSQFPCRLACTLPYPVFVIRTNFGLLVAL